MSGRLQHREDLMMPLHPLLNGQRATNDQLIRVIYRDGRPSTVEYASRGRANYLLERYSRENFTRDSKLFCCIERVRTS